MAIFKDEEKLSSEYVPSTLPHREGELNILRTFFSGVMEGKSRMSVRVLISGSVGTGKTVLVNLFGREAESEAKDRGRGLKYIYVNCRISRSLFTILRRITEVLSAPLPRRGISNEEMVHGILNYIREKGLHVIVAMDEVEILFKEQGEERFLLLN